MQTASNVQCLTVGTAKPSENAHLTQNMQGPHPVNSDVIHQGRTGMICVLGTALRSHPVLRAGLEKRPSSHFVYAGVGGGAWGGRLI